MSQNINSQEDIEDWLVEKLVEVAKLNVDDVDVTEPLASYGINSVDAVHLSGELEDWLGYEIPSSIIYQFPTIEALANHLSSEQSND